MPPLHQPHRLIAILLPEFLDDPAIDLLSARREIEELTGHKTLALVQRYTEAAGREGMADSAIERLIARPNGERNLANLPKRFVKSDTKPKQGKDNL